MVKRISTIHRHYSHRVISLKNGQSLVPREAVEASERDPTNRVIRDRLQDLSGGQAAKAIDCGRVLERTQVAATDSPSACALRAFAERKPFYVRYYHDHGDSVRYQGFAGDGEGNLYEVDYDDSGWKGALLPKEARLLDGGLTVVMPCPKPSTLNKIFEEDSEEHVPYDRGLTCSRPTARQNSQIIRNRRLLPVHSTEELLANRQIYNHTLVAVRGCYTEGFERSVLTRCSLENQDAPSNEMIWVDPAPAGLAKNRQAWDSLRSGQVVLFGQFETTDWRDEPTGGVGPMDNRLLLVDVLSSHRIDQSK